jgi:hypothetical protein
VALELGPDAVNMAGAARGALRISKALAVAGLLEGPKTKLETWETKKVEEGREKPQKLKATEKSTEAS